jgi:hypothetical protein
LFIVPANTSGGSKNRLAGLFLGQSLKSVSDRIGLGILF